MLDSKLDQMWLTVEDHGQRVSPLELTAENSQPTVSQQVVDLEFVSPFAMTTLS